MTIPRILIIAGSDSGGGAGIQADIKTVTMLGGHAMTAITALTAQNTLGLRAVSHVPPELIEHQMAAVIDDIGIDAIKIGMLGTAATVRVVSKALMLASRNQGARVPLVLDTVMVAKGGAKLLDDEAIDEMTERLFPVATLITPNTPELALLSGLDIGNEAQAAAAARRVAVAHGCMVLAKGGHLEGTDAVDQLVGAEGVIARWSEPRIESRSTHGTGCTLSSAIAIELGKGSSLPSAIERARAYVRSAIRAAPGLGSGHGPMGHALGNVPFDLIR
jgi:hydroxymethylpyrimidine/phosphomethylpyrimidine kinase